MRTSLAVSTTSFALTLLLLVAPGTGRGQNLFVSNYGADNYGFGSIEEFNSSGVGTVFASSDVAEPTGLGFDSQGNLYMNSAAGYTLKFNSLGVRTIFCYTFAGGAEGLAFDNNGNLYVASEGSLAIWEFNASGAGAIFATGFVTPYTGYVEPIGLAFDSSGNLFATSQYGGSTIQEFNTNGVGTLIAYSGPGLNGASGLAFDKNGNLYVANAGNNTIEEFNTNDVGTIFASTGLDYPVGLAFDSAGNLYAANMHNNTIEEFNTNGVGTVFASTGLDDPTYLAFQPVPEPSTWAMVAMGIGVVLGGLRLRRRLL
jgi:DNA-binding beta-propeller fold protein YncE